MAVAKVKIELRISTCLWIVACCLFAVNYCNGQQDSSANSTVTDSKSVKKSLNISSSHAEVATVALNSTMAPNPIPHTDNLPIDVNKVQKPGDGMDQQMKPTPGPTTTLNSTVASSEVHVQEPSYKKKIFNDDDDIPESFQTSFYFFLGLSCVSVVFIVVKVYRLRLSRAERKYGVQGDRTTQELTPLPISIEDGNSDDDDQTLFEVNRQQIRIL